MKFIVEGAQCRSVEALTQNESRRRILVVFNVLKLLLNLAFIELVWSPESPSNDPQYDLSLV